MKNILMAVLLVALFVSPCFSFCEDPFGIPFLTERRVVEKKLSDMWGTPKKKSESLIFWQKDDGNKFTHYTTSFANGKLVGIGILVVMNATDTNNKFLKQAFATIEKSIENSKKYKKNRDIDEHSQKIHRLGAEYICKESPEHIVQLATSSSDDIKGIISMELSHAIKLSKK